jgi:4-hydroxybenzoate polyprenyltransferase/phosphoserine phosphatase
MSSATERILAVDLDGTVLRTDLLWEALTELVRQKPYLLLLAPFVVLGGRVRFKQWIARHVQLDLTQLPLNEPVVEFVRNAKREGRTVVLATAALQQWAAPIAHQLGCFDHVIATTTVNHAGKRKLEQLRVLCNGAAFDYIGDRGVDVPLWSAAAGAFIVGNPARYQRRIGKAFYGAFPAPRPKSRDWLAALRIEQWSKNLLVFVPLFLAHALFDSAAVTGALTAAVLLSIIASALYVFNDLMDIPRDRRHPIKRNRPLARGIIPLPHAWGLVIAGLVAGFGLAYVTLPSAVVHLLALYAVSSVAYSLALKHQPIVDVLMLGGLYTLRIIIGGSAARIEVSPWLLGFSLLFFASLALLKRHSEVVQLRTTPDLLERTRPYTTDDEPFLLATGIASASLAVVILVLYLTGERARMLYTHPDRLWLVLPLLLFWVMRMWRFSVQGRLQGDPLTASLRDPASIATAVAIIALVGFLAR